MKAQDEVKAWARASGRKLGWLALQVPVTTHTMSRWLNGKTVPSAICRNRLADMTQIESLRDLENWQ